MAEDETADLYEDAFFKSAEVGPVQIPPHLEPHSPTESSSSAGSATPMTEAPFGSASPSTATSAGGDPFSPRSQGQPQEVAAPLSVRPQLPPLQEWDLQSEYSEDEQRPEPYSPVEVFSPAELVEAPVKPPTVVPAHMRNEARGADLYKYLKGCWREGSGVLQKKVDEFCNTIWSEKPSHILGCLRQLSLPDFYKDRTLRAVVFYFLHSFFAPEKCPGPEWRHAAELPAIRQACDSASARIPQKEREAWGRGLAQGNRPQAAASLAGSSSSTPYSPIDPEPMQEGGAAQAEAANARPDEHRETTRASRKRTRDTQVVQRPSPLHVPSPRNASVTDQASAAPAAPPVSTPTAPLPEEKRRRVPVAPKKQFMG